MNTFRLNPSTSSSVSFQLLRLSIFLLLSLPGSKGKAICTAHLNITFQVGNRIISELGESGVFGNHSPLERVSGALVLPDGWNQNACNPLTNFSRPEHADSWLALIERGGCTFTHKINVAAEKGANGVIIYNYPAAVAYILYCACRSGMHNSSTRRGRRVKADVKKAIGQLQLRVLKEEDKELDPDEDNCVVCLDTYKPQDVIRILTCKHFFHKTCIDPWLLAHRTCPMCKCDILKI
ncbi:RING finger protein 148 isoform X2 [Fukomys damarensis]|uniref:RING finger protein 148 isoform X2 n=1 Tax=Fukomys damarensis TaxID=885580 RepID=UPI00053F9D42|nr:RING finger protein 148 isoform X2 [Fukomys damarensis]